MKKKLCITTYYDDKFKSVGDISLLTIRKYGEKHNADIFVANNLNINRPKPWMKNKAIEYLFDLGYEYVMWMDADALFVRYDESILNECERGKELYIVAHSDGIKKIPNAGVMLIKNTFLMKRLLKKIWKLKIYIEHSWWENAALIHLISKEDFSDNGISNDRKTLSNYELSKIKYMDLKWNSIPGAYNNTASSLNPIIKHYAGHPFDYRIKQMQKDFYGG